MGLSRRGVSPSPQPVHASTNVPSRSMFLWIDVSPLPDTYDLVMNNALARGVLAIPGFAFMPNGGKTSFVRASFSIVDMADAEQGFRALGEAIREMRGELGL